MPLEGRVAVVTGASRRAGIGFAVAQGLTLLGAEVVVQGWSAHDATHPWGADPDGVDGVVDSLRSNGGRAFGVELDLERPESPREVIDFARTASGGTVSVLVVNHARSGSGDLASLTANEIDGFLRVNVRASLLLVREFAEQCRGTGGGRVVLLTSGQHLGGMPEEVCYAVSKGALHQATRTLSDALIARRITVNAVNPGPTDTGWGVAEWDPSAVMPLGRWGAPEDAARLICWLCTPAAGWVTGQVIDSEGGMRR